MQISYPAENIQEIIKIMDQPTAPTTKQKISIINFLENGGSPIAPEKPLAPKEKESKPVSKKVE